MFWSPAHLQYSTVILGLHSRLGMRLGIISCTTFLHPPLQTGSFRVDSHGRQTGIRKKRYAGSETHLTELLEKVCDLMSNYGVTTDPTTGEKGYMRINSRAGETITISNVNFSSDGARELSNAVSCLRS